MPLHSKTLKTSTGDIEISETVAGHLLWTAMTDFRSAIVRMNNLTRKLSENAGGSNTNPEYSGASSYPVPDDRSITMHSFVQRMQGIMKDAQDALRRAEQFSYGEVWDTLIDLTIFGPEIDERGYRKVIVNDESVADPTFVIGDKTGIQMWLGQNSEVPLAQGGVQPFVTISTEGCGEHLHAFDGEPILSVSLNDADLYDNEGNGDRTKKED